jgi:H+/Cl- antiporter ClcA
MIKLGRGPWRSLRWRIRLTLWFFAALTGLLVAAFAKLADWALTLFFTLESYGVWVPFLLAPAVGMATVWLTQRYFPGIQGSGIPQVIAATRLATQGRPVGHLVSLRIAVGKILLGAFALIGGFSAGREGPSVQVAASVLSAAHRFLPLSRAIRMRDLILAGGAAGVSAAFNTPLAGIVFAVEELGRRLETRTSGILVSSIILSGLLSMALLGNYNYFGRIRIDHVDLHIVLPIVVCGALCGALGGLLSRLILWPQHRPDFSLWRWRAAHPVLFAGGCGLVVALLGGLGSGLSYGSGYSITAHVVSGEATLPWHAPITRFLATLASYHSGIPGGIFAPSLAVGAAVGSNISVFFGPEVGAIPVVTLCMTGFLAAVTQAPITSAIIVMEMVDGHNMVLSLMAVALLARAVSSRMGTELYQQLAWRFWTESREREQAP